MRIRGIGMITKKLRGALAKAKANAVTVIKEIVENSDNRRWIRNKDEKHAKDAPDGWYRYDSYFGMPVQGSGEDSDRINIYKVTLVVRIKGMDLFLYDMINIKKKRVRRISHKDCTVKNRFSLGIIVY